MSGDKLEKLVRMLSSDQPGEVFNAVQSIARELRSVDKDWSAIAGEMASLIRRRSEPTVCETWKRTGMGNLMGEVNGHKCMIFSMRFFNAETFGEGIEYRTVGNIGLQSIWDGPFESEGAAQFFLLTKYGSME